MPAVWIAWSLLFFCASILDFVWEQPYLPDSSSPASSGTFIEVTQSQNTSALVSLSHTDRIVLAPRIIISFTFVLGLIYLLLVVRTFRRWGDPRIPEDVRESMETGRWTPRSRSPGRSVPGSPRQSRESRFEIADEKSGMKQIGHERTARSVDSESVV